MDTSKEYIKMCDCPEIQLFSLASKWERWSIWFFWDALFAGNALPNYCSPVWLPRQDQLQEMVGRPEMGDLLNSFYEFYGSDYHLSTSKFMFEGYNSMEQLWLAFVMWELYQKRWDGKTWTGDLNVRQDSK